MNGQHDDIGESSSRFSRGMTVDDGGDIDDVEDSTGIKDDC